MASSTARGVFSVRVNLDYSCAQSNFSPRGPARNGITLPKSGHYKPRSNRQNYLKAEYQCNPHLYRGFCLPKKRREIGDSWRKRNRSFVAVADPWVVIAWRRRVFG